MAYKVAILHDNATLFILFNHRDYCVTVITVTEWQTRRYNFHISTFLFSRRSNRTSNDLCAKISQHFSNHTALSFAHQPAQENKALTSESEE